MNSFRIISENRRFSARYGVYFNELTIEINESSYEIEEVFEDIMDYIRRTHPPFNRIRFAMEHEDLDQPINLPFIALNEFTVQRLLDILEKLNQSNKCFTNIFKLHIITLELPIGEGRMPGPRKRKEVSIDTFISKKKSIRHIINADVLCLPRAIVVGKSYADRKYAFQNNLPFNEQYHKKLVDYRKSEQKRQALHLSRQAKAIGGSINDIEKYQRLLKNYQIIVYNVDKKMYTGFRNERQIFLLFHNNHYDVITNIKGYLRKRYFCARCTQPHNDRNHCCRDKCKSCHSETFCKKTGELLLCSNCNRYFKNPYCFKKHKESRICDSIKRCLKCAMEYSGSHLCDTKCAICRKAHPGSRCFVKQVEEKQDRTFENYRRLYFDFESIIENGIHQPILCVIQYQVSTDFEELTFYGKDCAKDFVRWLLQPDPDTGLCIRENTVCLAHNNSAYDAYLILNCLYELNILPEVIMRGCKLLYLSILGTNITFIDSFNFISVALRKLPTLFDTQNVRKGFFPHWFHSTETLDYIGNLPDKHFFHPENMKKDELEEFNKWYEDHKWIVFDLKRELIAYCRSDVNVLRITCEKFRKLLIEKTTVDPFQRHFTISSFGLYVFRKLFLQPNTIGIVPSRGYRHNDRQSITALKYFKQLERTEGFSFQSCLTSEYCIGPYKLDAVHHKHKVIIEFNGCFYHAHPKCTPQHLNHPLYLNVTYEQVYERTLDRIKFIKDNMPDYELRVVWECEVVIEDNAEVEIQSPISSRDALYGGRVDCLKLYEEVGTDIDQIMYLDFCSLYPTMNKRKSYPKGHPDIITKDFDYSIDVYYGVMKAKLLPPTDLFHPVLPMRINGKLQFPLCHQCSIDKTSQCNHSDNERCLLGTWCTPEIYTACREGYKLVKIYEVWHYPTQFKEGELFGNYIDMFLEIKQSSSGYPSNIITDEQKQKFIENFYEREGIQLSKIEKNNALRAV